MTAPAPSPGTAEAPGLTVDAFLGGRVEALQPASGHHRSGLEAVLLGASLDPRESGTVIDLGAGAGVAGFCAAARCPAASLVLIERDPLLVEASRRALARPANAAFAARVRTVAADIADGDAIARETGVAVVLINPPFNRAGAMSRSPRPGRAAAHALDDGHLADWLDAAERLLAARGRVTVIFRAEGLDELLAGLGRSFGGLDVLAVHPRRTAPAHRVLVTAVKGSRAAPRILPPLVLHGDNGNAFLPEIDRLLRDGAGLQELVETWQERR